MDLQNGNFALFFTSNANLATFPTNNALKFANILKETVKLDPNVDFRARLANFYAN